MTDHPLQHDMSVLPAVEAHSSDNDVSLFESDMNSDYEGSDSDPAQQAGGG